MGHFVRWQNATPVVEATTEPGNRVEVHRGGEQLVYGLYLLDLDLDSPLTPRTSLSLKLPKASTSDFVGLTPAHQLPRPPSPKSDCLVWWCQLMRRSDPVYLLVRPTSLTVAKSKAEAYCALGAVEVLRELGLEDAAISLATGDFDHASVQMIQERERRRKLR